MTWTREENPYDGDYPEGHPGMRLRYKLLLSYFLVGGVILLLFALAGCGIPEQLEQVYQEATIAQAIVFVGVPGVAETESLCICVAEGEPGRDGRRERAWTHKLVCHNDSCNLSSKLVC